MNPYVNLFGRSVDLKEFQLSCELSFFSRDGKNRLVDHRDATGCLERSVRGVLCN